MAIPDEETTIGAICEALVETLGAAISGITAAIDPPPPKLDTAQLPALWAFTGQTTDDEETLGANLVLVNRQFRVQVAVIPTGQGNPKTREELCRPLLGRVKKAYRKYKNLGGVAGVQSSRVAGDSGVVLLPEYGGAFIGFEVRMEVAYVCPRTVLD